MRSCDIHLRVITHMLKISILNIILKIINSRLLLNFPGVNELSNPYSRTTHEEGFNSAPPHWFSSDLLSPLSKYSRLPLQRRMKYLMMSAMWQKKMNGGGRIGFCSYSITRLYRKNFHTWVEIAFTWWKVLLKEKKDKFAFPIWLH